MIRDIDWRAGTVTLRGTKSLRQDVMPLPMACGQALADYLQHERLATSRAGNAAAAALPGCLQRRSTRRDSVKELAEQTSADRDDSTDFARFCRRGRSRAFEAFATSLREARKQRRTANVVVRNNRRPRLRCNTRCSTGTLQQLNLRKPCESAYVPQAATYGRTGFRLLRT
jgi:hypothetical protein